MLLIQAGKAYVDDLSADEIRDHRGTLTEPGRNSPYRDRQVAENLELFERMRRGEFPDGSRVLRAKIDMAAGNINLRDPVMYRILHARHPRTGDAWCLYPTYDYAHGQSDALEGITHSICTLEFEDHRPLYDWFVDNLPVPARPRQYEFARLNLSFTVLSKRFLLRLVNEKRVRGWDDPRMPTISGIRRRGFPAEAMRQFAEMIGVARRESTVDYAALEYSVRQVLNKSAARRMAVLRPVKVVLTNYPEGQVEEFDVVNNPEDPTAGTRKVRVRARALHRARRLHGRPAQEVLPLVARQRGALTLGVLHHLSGGREGRRGSGDRAALHVRSRDARRRRARTAAHPRRRSTGSRPPMPCRARCGSTITCSRAPIPAPSGIFSKT